MATSLKDITLKDIRVDESGRVVISNPELAEIVKKALPEFGALPETLDTNVIACTSNSGCGRQN